MAIFARDSIEVVFALLGPWEGSPEDEENASMRRPLAKDSAETWEFLSRLRSTAWLKAGLDPTICLTRQQAITYCLSEPEASDDAAPVHLGTDFSETLVDPSIFPTDAMMTGQDFTNVSHDFDCTEMYPARWVEGLNDFNFDAIGFEMQ